MKGLNNFGNTCYLNSIIQILFNTPGFYEGYKKYASQIHSDHPLHSTAIALYKLMINYHVIENTNPESLRSDLISFIRSFNHSHQQYGFGAGMQEDGHEYLMFLFRTIHDSMYREYELSYTGKSRTRSDKLEKISIESHRRDGSSTTELMLKENSPNVCYNSVIFELFTGQYRFETQCQNVTCEYVSNRFETFRCCEVPIGNEGEINVTLNQVLSEFASVTQLDDEYECDKCKVRNRSYRRCTFWRPPPILIINLKRTLYFSKDGAYHNIKDTRLVNVPLKLDLKDYCSAPRSNTSYELYATANHHGNSQGGHYYAQIREDGKWKIADDDQISEGVCDPIHAYLLFYHQSEP